MIWTNGFFWWILFYFSHARNWIFSLQKYTKQYPVPQQKERRSFLFACQMSMKLMIDVHISATDSTELFCRKPQCLVGLRLFTCVLFLMEWNLKLAYWMYFNNCNCSEFSKSIWIFKTYLKHIYGFVQSLTVYSTFPKSRVVLDKNFFCYHCDATQ